MIGSGEVGSRQRCVCKDGVKQVNHGDARGYRDTRTGGGEFAWTIYRSWSTKYELHYHVRTRAWMVARYLSTWVGTSPSAAFLRQVDPEGGELSVPGCGLGAGSGRGKGDRGPFSFVWSTCNANCTRPPIEGTYRLGTFSVRKQEPAFEKENFCSTCTRIETVDPG